MFLLGISEVLMVCLKPTMWKLPTLPKFGLGALRVYRSRRWPHGAKSGASSRAAVPLLVGAFLVFGVEGSMWWSSVRLPRNDIAPRGLR